MQFIIENFNKNAKILKFRINFSNVFNELINKYAINEDIKNILKLYIDKIYDRNEHYKIAIKIDTNNIKVITVYGLPIETIYEYFDAKNKYHEYYINILTQIFNDVNKKFIDIIKNLELYLTQNNIMQKQIISLN